MILWQIWNNDRSFNSIMPIHKIRICMYLYNLGNKTISLWFTYMKKKTDLYFSTYTLGGRVAQKWHYRENMIMNFFPARFIWLRFVLHRLKIKKTSFGILEGHQWYWGLFLSLSYHAEYFQFGEVPHNLITYLIF